MAASGCVIKQNNSDEVVYVCADHGADVKSGLNVRFDESTLRTSMKDIEKWIHDITK